MKRLGLVLAFVGLLSLAGAQAQSLVLPGPGLPVASGGGSYTGPGDLTLSAATFTVYHGFRCYKASGSGSTKALRLINETTTTQADINCNSSTGIDLSAVSTLGCGSAVCKVVTMYDQTGNNHCNGAVSCDITQATDGNRPTYNATAGAGSKPCAVFASGNVLATAVTFTGGLTQPFSQIAVSERTANFTTQQTISVDSSSFTGMYYSATANSVLIYAGTLSGNVTASDSAFHAFVNLYNGASSQITVDGSASTPSPNPGGNGISGGGTLAVGVASGNLTGTFCEDGWLSATVSGADETALNTNMHNGYSF